MSQLAQLENVDIDEDENDYVSARFFIADDGAAAETNEEDEPVSEPRKRKAVDDAPHQMPRRESKLPRIGQMLEKHEAVIVVAPEPALRSRYPRFFQLPTVVDTEVDISFDPLSSSPVSSALKSAATESELRGKSFPTSQSLNIADTAGVPRDPTPSTSVYEPHHHSTS